MGTLVGKLSNCCDYFFRLSRFPDLSGKVFLSLLNAPNLITQQCFARAIQIKQFSIFLMSLKYREIIPVHTTNLFQQLLPKGEDPPILDFRK